MLYTLNNLQKNILKPSQQKKNIWKTPDTQEPSIKSPTKNNINMLSPQNQKRYIKPTNNIIDLYNNLNSDINCEKTIISVFDYNHFGFGDYLRGSILLAQYAKHFNINFKMDISKHDISEYLNNEPEYMLSNEHIHVFSFNGNDKINSSLHKLINDFRYSKKENLYIITNLYYQ